MLAAPFAGGFVKGRIICSNRYHASLQSAYAFAKSLCGACLRADVLVLIVRIVELFLLMVEFYDE
ncbi:hypothetical protein TH1_16590 [Thalassospira lucentensis MCCC 1A00383 = DSM 14000]|uniref:Uncharacterized protein n=1 Tax=Thalassospira lucentensis TaxID=168935 RepID=A0A358HMA7_9PROT|nr:hypothetical protein [Thalassospira sp.]RCK23478.1 hypothetical protein TH1_16590 [Thalassospira lucentensis MCCC 1A00383 = DSM 14000]HBU96309.1 hypothetical protein [Thalassospira lucentensis]HCW66029.1 hypothetical protein [Thalassospira lucentensis]